MAETSSAPDIASLDIPMDTWTQPFWKAAERGELRAPRCTNCGRFRWPPGAFCPRCQHQAVDWVEPGPAHLYSFTILHGRDDGSPIVSGLVEFPEADGIRIPAAIVDTPLSAVRIGAALTLGWSQAANARVPVFSISGGDG